MELQVKPRRCIAFREGLINGSIVFVPCMEKVRKQKRENWTRRFCHTHERAYREILLGILQEGAKE